MSLPIFDITNIPNKRLCIAKDTGAYTRYKHLMYKSIEQQIEHLYKMNGLSTFHGNEKIHFVDSNCSYNHINTLYKQYYKGEYNLVTYQKLTYLVMQKGTPIQIFIPEDKYTFLEEYLNLVLTIDNIDKLNNKIIRFSLYYNDKNSMLSKALVTRINECKIMHFVYLCFKDTFIMDFVNEITHIMYILLSIKHVEQHMNMLVYYYDKFNNVTYGFQ